MCSYLGLEPFRLNGKGEGEGGREGCGRWGRGSRASRESVVKFQTLIAQKRLEITISIRYANFSAVQALSIGKGFGALGGRISEKVGQNFILVLEIQKWLETIVPLI